MTGIYDIREEAEEEARAYSLHVYDSAAQIFADPAIHVIIISTPKRFA